MYSYFKSKVHFCPITNSFVNYFTEFNFIIAVLNRLPGHFVLSGFLCVFSCSLMLVGMLICVLYHQIGFVYLEE